MTEENKDQKDVTQETGEQAPAKPENPPAEAPKPGSSAPTQGGPAYRGTGAPAQGNPPRPQNRPPMQGQRPGGGQYQGGPQRPPNPNAQQGPRTPGSQPQAPRPQYPRPPQRQGDPSQEGTPPGQRPAQPGSKPPIDWLRSKPVPTSQRPAAPQRGLDLGRPDAWMGRQKPPTGSTTGPAPRPPQGSDQRPAGTGGPPRPPQSGAPYRPGPRPTGSGPYTPRPGGSGPRPGGFGPRPGGFGGRPGGFGARPGAPTTGWGKDSATSRRARSARKGGKEKEKPVIEEDADERARRRAEGDAARGKPGVAGQRPGMAKPLLKGKFDANAPEISKAIAVPARITVKDLADVLSISSVEIIKELMKSGIMAPINQTIDFDTASIVASDLGFEIRQAELPEEEEAEPAAAVAEAPARRRKIVEEDPSLLEPRPPVVTIMGHVDHGKTSLLDAIRRTNVAGGEFGGITQHIGAYQVEEKGQKITFLDTPGHEAFTAMRARGAQVTDVAIVVVAADDGVQPQTLEAINHARAAGVPIVVALNKVDKDTANPDRVKQQLSDAGLMPEDWGGSTVVVPVSAKKLTGVNDLLDMILLVAEMANLKANPNRTAIGTIVEAEMDKSKGPMATVLVQTGTLNVGDQVVVGSIYGKIRAMFNDKGEPLPKATPSTPASILGLSDVPQSGDILEVLPSEREARALVDDRLDKEQREAATAALPTLDLEKLSSMIAAGTVKDLNIVLKADVQGSLEPIVNSLSKLANEKEKVKVNLLHSATGQITEGDVALAAASMAGSAEEAAMVIGFNVEADPTAKRTAEMLGVEIRTFKVIYDLVDAIEKALKGMFEPKYEDAVDGHAEVRQVFKLSKGVTIAGAIISDGTITRGALVRVKRGNSVVFEGKVSSLRRFKDDVREVTAGFECGITLDGFNDFQEKDIVEAHHKERIN